MTEATSDVAPTILTCEYNAPKQLVFEAWTDPKHLVHWNFPFEGFQCEYLKADITGGGSSLHKMTAPNGFQMFLLTEYESITPPDELVFLQYNSNENGDKLPNPQMPNWPEHMRTTIRLKETDGKTELELIWQPVNPTAEEAEVFEGSRSEHQKGWGGGLEMLGRYLDSI